MRWVMITPSYGPDFARCEILCRSIDLCVPDSIPHLLIVDRRDLAAFSPLQSKRRQIIAVEDLLPWWIWRPPLARRWWLNLRGKPIRNWVLQQIVKIQAASTVDADAVLFLDSDVTFIRPFSPHQLEKNGKVALTRVAFSSAQHALWRHNAATMVDVDHDQQDINYVGNLISWRAEMARALIAHLGKVRHRHWIHEFTSNWQVSEYMVYGTFVEKVIGIEAAGHFPAAMPLIHLSWEYDLGKNVGVDEFFSALKPNHVAVMIHSKDGVDPERYLPNLQEYWEKLDS
jgi:hypothetical protein